MDATRCIDDSESGFPNSSLTDSRKWLFHYPGQLKPEEKSLKLSTTKESYGKPEIDRHPKQGRRKKLLEDFYRKVNLWFFLFFPFLASVRSFPDS